MDAVIQRELPAEGATTKEWLNALRLHQWSKNILTFVPLVLSHKYGGAGDLLNVLITFLAIGLVASGTYLINDLSDIEADRQHKTKCRRAIARGAIGPGSALAASSGLIVTGFALAAALSLTLVLLLFVYLATTLFYSIYLKRVAMLDVAALGALYAIRVMMGEAAIGATESPWLLMFSLFFFLSLALAKRHVEIARIADEQPPGTLIGGRGYCIGDGPLTFGFGLSTGVTAVLILILYVANDAYPIGIYGHPRFLWLIAPIVLLWIMRIWLLSHRAELDDDPVAFAIKDPPSWALGATAVAVFVLATL
jgi:4-hydroxybenzoate polyprenyltransferase